MSDNIDELLQWCERARVILAKTGGKKQEAAAKFDSELASVRVKLERLIEIAGESTPVVQGFITALGTIASKALGLSGVDDKKNAGKEGQKRLREQAKVISADLMQLGKQIDASKPAKAILDARERFFAESARSRIRAGELGTQPHANTMMVAGVLAFIGNLEQRVRSEAPYQDPAKCDEATRLIAEKVAQLVRQMEVEAKSERNLDEKHAKAKPQVEDRRAIAQRLLDEGQLSGELTKEMQTRLETTLREIDTKASADLWTDALTLCMKLPTASECKKAFLLTKVSLNKNFAKELKQCEDAFKLMSPVLDAATLEQEQTRYNQFLGEGKGDGLNVGKMTRMIEDWAALTTARTKEKTDLAKEIADLEAQLGRREATVGLPQKAENARQFELVTSLRDQLLFTAARQAGATLKRQLVAQRPAVEDERAWRDLLPGAAKLVTDLGTKGVGPNVAPQLQADARRLATALSPETIARLTAVRDWQPLLTAHKQAKDFLAGLGKETKKFADFEPQRKPLDDDMAREWAKVESNFNDFTGIAKIAKVDAAPMLRPLRGELDALKREWAEWLANTTRESKTTIKTTKDKVAALLLKVDALAHDDILKAEAARQADDAGRARFDSARITFENKELSALKLVDVIKGQELTKRKEALASDDKKSWDDRIKALGLLAKEAAEAAAASRIALGNTNSILAEAIGVQKLKLAELRKVMNAKKGVDIKKFAPLLDGLNTELLNLELLTTTQNMSAAKANDRLLGELSARIANLKSLVEHGSTFEDYGKSLARYTESIAQLKTDGLPSVAADTATALNEQLATLKTDLYSMEPGKAAVAMRAMAAAIADAQTELQGIRNQQDKVVLAASDCQRRVAAFAKLGLADAYRQSLESRVAEAQQRSKVARELPTALRELETIQAELAEVEANPQAALARQKTLLAEQHATLKLKREWEGRLAVVQNSVMKRLNAALKGGGDKSQKDEVDRMVAMAEKAVKTNKDYERGLHLLTQVEGRVAQIERNPEGTALGDRKALPKHVEGYATNVIQLRSALDNFVAKAAEKVTDPAKQKVVLDALRKQVDPLTIRLNPGLFTLSVQDLVDDKLPDTRRREAREQALARVRETLAFLTTHPTMVKLGNNPIVPLQADMRALDASLTRLEAHLRAAVR
jgi:hypothetical protein